ncbi:DUF2059 domain-containing protein [Novosphingobium pokkalii]|uniref:DUF2059 domain-containing protein n=1 Tax=Novosphingobium pokkalii TaxID=1770194 RepID=A0ABV7V2M8_9SPHN|nr:DUF2059 domain-containing protein [Novosphingobium pokkalii]GHC87199.1 hypothetical protein GCM10019060_09300 [Novosphingobium pokkalii]
MLPARHLVAVAGLALAGTAALPSAAQAQTPPPAARPLDPADMQVASQIIAVILPPEQRLAIVERVTRTMMSAMQGNMGGIMGVDDPGLQQIVARMFEKMPAAMRPAMERRVPEMVDAMTRAYVRHFSREDLHAILAFAQTPAGSRYLSHAADLVQDPDVVTVMTAMNRDGMEVGMGVAKEFRAELTSYLTAHPDVAKKIAAAHAGQ